MNTTTTEPNADIIRFTGPVTHDSIYAELLASLAASPLAAYAEEIAGLAIRGVTLESTTPKLGAPLGAARLGGLPDLPEDVAYPCIDGEPLSFLCQLNMQEAGFADPRLPQRGMLYVFLGRSDACDEVESRVLYVDLPAASLRHTALPDGALPSEPDDYFTQGHGVRLRPTWSLPGYGDDTIKQVLPDSLLEAWGDFTLAWGEREHARHALMGYAEFDLWPPQDDAVKAYPHTLADDWCVLARIGFDKKTGFCFWDAGTLNFLVQKSALLRQDFSEVYTWLISG